MEIKKFRMQNVGRFESIDVELAPTSNIASNVTIFVGNNGSGKTSILKGLSTSLSWFVARIKKEKGIGSHIPEQVILNKKSTATIDICIQDDSANISNRYSNADDYTYHWTIAKTRKARKSAASSSLNDATALAEFYKNHLERNDKASLPLIAFYPVERVVLDIPLKIKGKHNFFQIDGYDNSLNQGVDFRRFFEWFREREDTENESGIPEEMFQKLQTMLEKDSDVWKKLSKLKASSRDRQLTAVRNAISIFMPGFSNLKVRRKPRLHMSIDKGDETFNVLQLSQGEKSLMALVGDIARRLAMMNPGLENPLEGDGVVLIDEVDMHLHPSWQRDIVSRLTNTFPNCQFVLTTHSPLVISDCKDVLVYSLDNGELDTLPSQYGADANTVLINVMDTHARNEKINEKLNDLYDLINDKKVDEARNLLNRLVRLLPDSNIELMKAKLMLKKRELEIEKNK